jgi:hypothetical protein
MAEVIKAGDNKDADICVICLEEIDSSTLTFGCNHKLHKWCTYDYACNQLRNNIDFTCPMCRHVQCYANSQEYNNLKRDMGIDNNKKLLQHVHVYVDVQPQERIVQRRSILRSLISGLMQCRQPIAT